MLPQVKVLKYSTFRLNLTCTAPYNADFDGDEMNMHIPQNHQARADVMTLMYVNDCHHHHHHHHHQHGGSNTYAPGHASVTRMCRVS